MDFHATFEECRSLYLGSHKKDTEDKRSSEEKEKEVDSGYTVKCLTGLYNVRHESTFYS